MTDWVTVARVEDLAEGEMVGATVEDVTVLVANVGGRYLSIGSECTHAACELSEGELDPAEGVVTCECHGSIFDLETGAVVAPPADEPEPVYAVRVEGDEVQVQAPA